MTGSLHSRLVVGTSLVISTALLVSGVAVHTSTRVALRAEFDSALVNRARGLAALVEETEKGIEFDFDGRSFPDFQRDDGPDLFQIWTTNGETLAKSSSLGARELSGPPEAAEAPVFSRLDWIGQPARRQVLIRWEPAVDIDEDEPPSDLGAVDQVSQPVGDELLTVAVARCTAPMETHLRRLAWLLAVVGCATVLACLLGLTLVVKRGLQPIRELASVVGSIDQRRLHQPISLSHPPTEVVPVVERLNEMLARLERAFQSERDFSHNVAHELRTPLAGLRSTIEVHLARPQQAKQYQAALRLCLQICEQSSTMIESLLSLSRVERQQVDVVWRSVQLDELLAEVWSQLAAAADRKQLQTTWSVPQTPMTSDPERLRVIFRNVLTNAVSHSSTAGSISIAASAEHGMVRVAVANSGNRVPADQLPRVFERFWRGDPSRHQTGEHFGLGLTLVKSFVESLGGRVDVTVERDQFRVIVVVPQHDSSSNSHSDLTVLSPRTS